MVGWSIADMLRKVHDAARLLAEGEQEFAVAKRLRLWGDAQALVCRAARALGPRRAARLLDEAMRTDMRTKSGLSSDDHRTYEALVVAVGERLR